jgi:hypothetical protein
MISALAKNEYRFPPQFGTSPYGVNVYRSGDNILTRKRALYSSPVRCPPTLQTFSGLVSCKWRDGFSRPVESTYQSS